MDCIFDKEKISEVLFDFYESTGIAITLYDDTEKLVATSPIHSGFCSCIRAQHIENCHYSDLIHMKEVSSNHQINCYTCHAGLMEMIMPVTYEDVLIAYLQVGQFKDTAQKYSSAQKVGKVAVKYGLDADKLLSLYEKVPIISEEKLKAICRIMEIIVKSFWVDGLICYNRSILSVKIEKYITEHITEKIYIEDLCKEFLISKNALYQLFHNEFGVTVNEFILGKRISLAKEKLKSGDQLNITQVAFECGFSDHNYFIRIFKKREGLTPLQYKKNA